MRFISAQSELTWTYLQRLYDLSVTTALRTLSATSSCGKQSQAYSSSSFFSFCASNFSSASPPRWRKS
ncbi:hypothetical protein CVS35_22335 [Pectobacterium atrosepticum]|nr:hypothetical protein CVS35_22335 [Pectobacterium atrosepticum]